MKLNKESQDYLDGYLNGIKRAIDVLNRELDLNLKFQKWFTKAKPEEKKNKNETA